MSFISSFFKSKLLGRLLSNRTQIRFQEHPCRSLDDPLTNTTASSCSVIVDASQSSMAIGSANPCHPPPAANLLRCSKRLTFRDACQRLWGFTKRVIAFLVTHLLLSLSVIVFLGSVKRCFLLPPSPLIGENGTTTSTTKDPALNSSIRNVSLGPEFVVSHLLFRNVFFDVVAVFMEQALSQKQNKRLLKDYREHAIFVEPLTRNRSLEIKYLAIFFT